MKVITGLFLTCAACAPGLSRSRSTVPMEGISTATDPVKINVTNNYGGPVELYAVASGVTRRVGTILPGLSSQFTVPDYMRNGGAVEFLAVPGDGNQPVRSGRLLLIPGNVVDFDIAAHPLNSSATVRPLVTPRRHG